MYMTLDTQTYADFRNASVKNEKKICKNWENMVSVLSKGFPDSSVDKESACSAGDPSLIPGLEDPLEKGEATLSSI